MARLCCSSTVVALLALAPVGLAPALLPTVAHAQQAAFAAPVVELLPPGEVVGDGVTPVTIHVVALNADGSPLAGLSGKPTVNAGKVSSMEAAGSGIYKITFTPPKVDAARPVELILKAKTTDKQTIDRRFSMQVTPPLSHQVTGIAIPNQIVLGQDPTANITFTLAGGASQPLAGVDLDVRASAGTVANVTHLGGGQFTALYTPPSQQNQQFPQLALITVADKRDPTRTYGALALPLVGKANFPVRGLPNSRLLVKIGDREFGPIQADGGGNAKVPLIVPPGYDTATVTSVLGEQRGEEKLDLKVPASSRLSLFPMPASVPADPTVGVPVRVYVTTPQGAPDAGASVAFTASSGQVNAARHEGNGVYVATFTPAASNTPTQVNITATVQDARGAQSSTLTVSVVPTRPASVKLTTEPATLPQGASAVKVFARVSGADGQGMTKRGLVMIANGAELAGAVKELGGGDYQALFNTTGNGPVEIMATATAAASNNPLRRVIAFTSRDRVPNDGLSSAMITILTLDEFGYPVANVPVEARVTQGDGAVPAKAITDASGIAQIFYTAGRSPGLARIEVRAGDHTGATAVLQAPGQAGAGVVLPLSGADDTVKTATAWRAIVQTARVEREGAPAIAPIATAPAWGAATPPPAATGAVVARLNAQAIPSVANPGDVLEIEVSALSADGGTVDGQTIELMASTGSVGPARPMGGGRYRFTLAVPAGASGEIKVAFNTADGSASSVIKVPVAAPEAAVWGAAPTTSAAPTTTAAPVATAAPTTTTAPVATVAPTTTPAEPRVRRTKTPATPSDRPWFRASAGYLGGLYSYSQRPLSSTGPLYQGNIAFGTLSDSDGSSPAPTAGIGVAARAWLPSMRWLGIEGSLRTSYYSVEIPGASDLIPDWYNDIGVGVLPRFIKPVGASELYVAGRAGLSVSDFMIYRQESDGNSTYLDFGPLFVPSLDLGAELGAEVGERWSFRVGGGVGLANASSYFSNNLGFSAAFSATDSIFIELSGAQRGRDTSVYLIPDEAERGGQEVGKKEVGEVSDRATQGSLSVGFQI